VKRNTAAIKKLRALSEETRVALLEELKGVNLTKYVSEAVAAVVEAKLKTADMNAAVQVCLLDFSVCGLSQSSLFSHFLLHYLQTGSGELEIVKMLDQASSSLIRISRMDYEYYIIEPTTSQSARQYTVATVHLPCSFFEKSLSSKCVLHHSPH
jgi:DNA-binding transcriptional ArsR family regulator